MATFTFDSVDEIRAFVKDHLKGTRRGGKGDDDGNESAGAPAPIMPPATAPTIQAGFTPAGVGFPSATPTPSFGGTSPEVTALVGRISAKIDDVIAKGQPADAVLNWFRERCGTHAAAATLDQIKTVFLAKLSVPHLEETAKFIGA
jgi:hypothetical protein